MSSAPPPPAGQGYFTDSKKGEVNELKALLKNMNVEKNPKRKRDIIKKVIAYMTLGIDVSRLFNDMVMCVETKDLVVKKMVYLYLVQYAQEHPEMALMCINTLHRDANNEDPMVRGLALRSLCSLRLPSMVEYIADPLRKALNDNNAYVRRTAVMGILKLYHLQGDLVKGTQLVDVLYDMIQDTDGAVVSNCIAVLNEIMLDEGGMAINQPIIHHLLNRLNDFNEWGLPQVLDLVARYSPVDDQEVFTIMNLLDPVLRTTNSGVVLVTIKVFIHLTKSMKQIHQQLYERIKAPMLTLIAGSSPELVYCLLQHTELLLHRCPGIFDEDFKQFYTKFNEPLQVKFLKIDILARLVNVNNRTEILDELSVYVSELDVDLARRAIRAIGVVGDRLPTGFENGVFERLIEFLDLDVDYVVAESLLVLKDLLRKYPERRSALLPVLPRCLKQVDEAKAKAAVLWMVGEYGEEIIEAPYMVEHEIDNYENETSAEVKLSLLTCATNLFFKRPPEVHKMLGRLLAHATNDTSSQDVHDRALFYYRLLKSNLDVAKKVIGAGDAGKRVSDGFTEDREVQIKDALFEEFNSLAVIYRRRSQEFIAPDKRPKDSIQSSASTSHAAPPAMAGGLEGNLIEPTSFEPASAAVGTEIDLLGGMGDAPVSPQDSWSLAASTEMSQDQFQTLWTQIAVGATETMQLPQESNLKADPVDSHLSSSRIFTMASGDLPDVSKLFLYATDISGATYLCELTITRAQFTAQATVKVTDQTHCADFVELLRQGLSSVPQEASLLG